MIRNLIIIISCSSVLLFSCKNEVEKSHSHSLDSATATTTAGYGLKSKESLSSEDILLEIIKSSSHFYGSDLRNDLRINVDPYPDKLRINLYQESDNKDLETYFSYDLELKTLSLVDKEGKHLSGQEYERRYADKLLASLGFDPIRNRKKCITDTIDIPLPTSSTSISDKIQKHHLKCTFNSFEQYRCEGDIYYSTLPPRPGFNYVILTGNCGDSSYDVFYIIKDGSVTDNLTINAAMETQDGEELETLITECVISKDYTIYLKKYQTDKSLKKLLSEKIYQISAEGKFVKPNSKLGSDSLSTGTAETKDTVGN